MPSMYLGAFVCAGWVAAGKLQWGLWYCDNQTENASCESSRETSLHDSEGYFIGCQAVGCVTLIPFTLIFFSIFVEYLRMPKRHIIVVFTAGAGCVTLLATFGSHYKDDDHWKDLDPCLGWCFWLMLAVAAGTCALGFISVYYAQKDQWKPLPKVAPLQQRSWRRASNASQISISKSKKIIIFRTEEYNSANMVLPQTTHQPADWDAQETISLKFPILDLPHYDLAPEPGSRWLDNIAPPDYEEVTKGSKSPLPAVVVI